MTDKICAYCGRDERLVRGLGHCQGCPVMHAAMGKRIKPFISAKHAVPKIAEPVINLPDHK